MAQIFKDVTELIGHTPLIELRRFASLHNLHCRILAKVESYNPGGSVKDRIAFAMIAEAQKRGLLKAHSTIIEPTSGNTGIGLAMVGAAKGYKVILTMPDTMSVERRSLLRAYGAQIVLTEGSKGMKGAIAKAREIAEVTPDSFIPSQFENMANPQAHQATTGPEIYHDTDGNIDVLVAGIGTGGTITGAGSFLKSKIPHLKVVAVEPTDSPILSKGTSGPHKIQGIGAGFVPSTLDTSVYDEIVTVSNEESFTVARELARIEGILIGISSGAALAAVLSIAKRPETEGKTIVVVLPDNGDRYLSTPLFAE